MPVARIAAAALAALVLASPAGTAQDGILYGVVRKGPITPVCAAERPCVVPAAGVTLVFSSGTRELGRTKSSQAGWYRIRLAPRVYTVRAVVSGRVWRVLKPVEVRVTSGGIARVNFLLDTGIR